MKKTYIFATTRDKNAFLSLLNNKYPMLIINVNGNKLDLDMPDGLFAEIESLYLK